MVKGDFSKLNFLWVRSNRNLTSFNQWAFEESAREVNKSAVEYFFHKLTHAERGASLMRTALALLANHPSLNFEEEKLSNALCYLLSAMTPEQQVEAIKAHPVTVYSCFRRFPLSDLFLENTNFLLPFLPLSSYDGLLQKGILRYDKIYFSKLFPEFFKQSPPDYKRFFVSAYEFVPAYGYLNAFFEEGDSEAIEAILRNVDAADRVKLVFNHRILSLFYDNIYEGRWPIVEVFLREAKLSKEEKKRMKDIFIERSRTELQELCKNPKLKVFYDFLDEADDNADTEKKARKRKLEDCCPE
ncbi:unnamed protein product [Larinioides sclopetarius]|uniref:Uncharacterized protein n=1 Tax=Larinioides sclopetarius TaxID=280406 RepID=A0AAV2BRV5_9ARAC